jgi:hypothetical protein
VGRQRAGAGGGEYGFSPVNDRCRAKSLAFYLNRQSTGSASAGFFIFRQPALTEPFPFFDWRRKKLNNQQA